MVRYLLFSFIILSNLLCFQNMEIYVNVSSSCDYFNYCPHNVIGNCILDCGTPTYPFKYLHEAIFFLDQIIESNSTTQQKFPTMASQFLTNSSTISFKLSPMTPLDPNGNIDLAFQHYLNFSAITTLINCSGECLFRFFCHNFTSNITINFQNYFNDYPGRINVDSSRIIFYTNYTQRLSFSNIFFSGNSFFIPLGNDQGLNSKPYGLFMLWPFVNNYSKSILSNESNSKLSFNSCSIEYFLVDPTKSNHSYSFLIGVIEPESEYYYTHDISSDLNLINPYIFINNTKVATNGFPVAIFSIQKGHLQIYNSIFSQNNQGYIFTLSDIWQSQIFVDLLNVKFSIQNPLVLKAAFNTTINFTTVTFSDSNGAQTLLNFNNSVNATFN